MWMQPILFFVLGAPIHNNTRYSILSWLTLVVSANMLSIHAKNKAFQAQPVHQGEKNLLRK